MVVVGFVVCLVALVLALVCVGVGVGVWRRCMQKLWLATMLWLWAVLGCGRCSDVTVV